MTKEALIALAGLEFQLVRVMADVADAAADVRRSKCDGAASAARELLEARRLVRRALSRIDGPLTAAAAAHEASYGPAPF